MSKLAASNERSFGFTVGGVLAFLAGTSAWRGHAALATSLGLLAVALIVPALLRPSLLRWPNAVWWRFAEVLAWVNSRVLLSLLFYGIFTPLGCLMRAGGWDPLRRRRRHASGWVSYPDRLRDPRHYERMY